MQDEERPHGDIFQMFIEYIDEINIGLTYTMHFQGGIEWLPHSPYLNVRVFSIGEHLKRKVCKTIPETVSEVKTVIKTALCYEVCLHILVGSQNLSIDILAKEVSHFEPLHYQLPTIYFQYISQKFPRPVRCTHILRWMFIHYQNG